MLYLDDCYDMHMKFGCLTSLDHLDLWKFTIFLLLKKKNKLHQDCIIKRGSTIAILTGKKSTY